MIMNFWSFLTISIASVCIFCCAIPAICAMITNTIRHKKEVQTMYKILDRSSGSIIDVPESTFNLIYKTVNQKLTAKSMPEEYINE